MKICIYGSSQGPAIAQFLAFVLAVVVFSSMLYGVSGLSAFAVFCGVVAGLVFGVASCATRHIVFEEPSS